MLGNSQQLQEKWNDVLESKGADQISDPYRKAVTSILLENYEKETTAERMMLSEAVPTMSTGSNSALAGNGNVGFGSAAEAGGPVAGFDPVLISMIRRSMPNLVAYDLAGVQPMNGPVGLIFAMRSKLGAQQGGATGETFYDEVNTTYSGNPADVDLVNPLGDNPALITDAAAEYVVGQGMETKVAEDLGRGVDFNEVSLSIEKISVTAKSRALKAAYSMEVAQDMRAIHGLGIEDELSNIITAELLAEINREVVRTIYKSAKAGAQDDTATQGIFDMDVDSNGRWSVEKFKGLMFQIERDANAIARETRRGKGNVIMCSADVASALAAAGQLDYAPALEGNNRLQVDETGNTFAGVLNGRYRVYIDPYATLTRAGGTGKSAHNYYVVGYKGSSSYDAGLFYCPYVPIQMVRSVGAEDFQPRIGFKTRYGMVLNPFARGADDLAADGADPLAANNLGKNVYYRRAQVRNLM